MLACTLNQMGTSTQVDRNKRREKISAHMPSQAQKQGGKQKNLLSTHYSLVSPPPSAHSGALQRTGMSQSTWNDCQRAGTAVQGLHHGTLKYHLVKACGMIVGLQSTSNSTACPLVGPSSRLIATVPGNSPILGHR